MAKVIFGGNGFIGRSLQNIKSIQHDELRLSSSLEIDLTSVDAILKIQRLVNEGDDVVMLACQTPEKGSANELVSNNILMMANVLKGLADKDIRHFVYISSDAVYSLEEEYVKEDTAKCPDTLYGHSHLVREEMIKQSISDEKLCILRPCAVYGHEDPHGSYGVMKFLRQVKAGGYISIFGNGEELRDHLHVDDLAQSINVALEEKICGDFNIASGTSTSFFDIAATISSLIRNKVEIIRVDRRVPIRHRYNIITKFKSAFSKIEPRSVEQGLTDLIAKND